MEKDLSNDIKDTKQVKEVEINKVKEYIDNLNPLEKIAYDIAVSRLKSSFDIEKSIGFKSK